MSSFSDPGYLTSVPMLLVLSFLRKLPTFLMIISNWLLWKSFFSSLCSRDFNPGRPLSMPGCARSIRVRRSYLRMKIKIPGSCFEMRRHASLWDPATFWTLPNADKFKAASTRPFIFLEYDNLEAAVRLPYVDGKTTLFSTLYGPWLRSDKESGNSYSYITFFSLNTPLRFSYLNSARGKDSFAVYFNKSMHAFKASGITTNTRLQSKHDISWLTSL